MSLFDIFRGTPLDVFRASAPPLCVDCRHYVPDKQARAPMCCHPKAMMSEQEKHRTEDEVRLLSGDPPCRASGATCFGQRIYTTGDRCQRSGRWFEPRNDL